MASNGLNKRAKHGTCRMCLRVRNTAKHLKIVGEVRHGFATGYVWECTDAKDCENTIERELSTGNKIAKHERIKHALKIGRFTIYKIFS